MRRMKSEPMGWHVFSRGARRLELFRDDDDYLKFLSLLRYALIASGCLLWGYTLMSNHYHLMLFGSSQQLTACMRRLNRLYSGYHNNKYGLEGHAFDGPYHAYRQGTIPLLMRCLAYIFLNPVAAGLVGTPERYRWSCYRSYVGLPGSPLEVDPSLVMAQVSPNPKEAWSRFHLAMKLETIRQARRPPPAFTMVEVHAQQFEWLLQQAEIRKEDRPWEDPAQVAMYWARKCGISPKSIARVLGRPTGSVRQSIYRVTSRVRKDPGLARLLALP